MMSNRLSDLEQNRAVSAVADRRTPSISIVIVSYNSRELLHDCLLSIEAEPREQVIVVDNTSSDGSIEMVKRDFPWVKLILNPKNNGYGAAANLAIESCSSKYVLLLNSDTLIKTGTLELLTDYLDQHPHVAIAGPQLLNIDGTPQSSYFEFPTPLQTLLKETSLSRFVRRSSPESNGSLAVPWVLGAALVIRRVAFEAVGGFDESFFMYFEEVDLCYRLDHAGWQTHFVPEASVMHVGAASTKRHRANMLKQFYKSLGQFYQQHYSSRAKIELKFVLTYLMFRNILKDMIRSFRPTTTDDARENLSVWCSILYNVWLNNAWINDRSA
jgi:GT2 family glycosyltransferase